jgi:hypothetical protein
MVYAYPCCKHGFINLQIHLAKTPLCSSRFWEIRRAQIREAQRQLEAWQNRPSTSNGASREDNIFPVSNVVFNLDLLEHTNHQSVATRLTRGQRKRRRHQQEHDEVSSLTNTITTVHPGEEDNNNPDLLCTMTMATCW